MTDLLKTSDAEVTAPQAMSTEQREAYRWAMRKDPWIFTAGVTDLVPGFCERVHRPLMYVDAECPRLLVAAMKRYESKVVSDLDAEFRRQGIQWWLPSAEPQVRQALRKVNERQSRSTGKSTVWHPATAWQADGNPDLSIGIFSKSDPNAEDFLEAIKRIYLGDRYRYYFPERFAPKNWERYFLKDAIWLYGRTNPSPQWTLQAQGINSATAGKHFNKIIIDDGTGQEEGDANINDCLRFHANVPGISIPQHLGGTSLLVKGTVYDTQDDNAFLRKDPYTVNIWMPIWAKERYSVETAMENGEPYMPEWYDVEAISRLRSSVINDKRFGIKYWLLNYELTAIDDAMRMFPESILEKNRYRIIKVEGRTRPLLVAPGDDPNDPANWVRPESLRLSMGVDQGVADGGTANSWGISVIGWDQMGRAWLLGWKKSKGYGQMLDQLPLLWISWDRPPVVGVDTSATQGMTLEFAKRSPELRAISGLLRGLKSGNIPKKERLRSTVQSRLITGELFLPPTCLELDEEARNYRADRDDNDDDLLDSIALAISVGQPAVMGLDPRQARARNEMLETARRKTVDRFGVPRRPLGRLRRRTA